MIVKHELSNVIVSVTKDAALEALGVIIKMRAGYKRIWEALVQYEDNEIDEFDLVDVIEANLVSDLKSAQCMADVRMSVYDPINHYFGKTMIAAEVTNNNLAIIRDAGYAPDTNELDKIKDGVYRSLSGVLYLLQWEFRCNDTCAVRKDNPDGEDIVDELLYTYFSSQARDTGHAVQLTVQFAEGVITDCQEFKMQLSVFDEAPEKERPFEAIIGPAIGSIDPDRLTMPVVDAVLAGEMTVEELLTKVGYETEIDDGDVNHLGAESIKAF